MQLYFAAPLFSAAERKFNQELADRLERAGFEVFLPQRDGVEKDRSPYKEMDPEERRRMTFETDRDRIWAADVFLFVLDGRVPDEGACVELGLAYAEKHWRREGKILVGLQTDDRAAFLGSKLNPMLKVPLDFICSTEEELLDFLQSSMDSAGCE